MSDDGIEVRVKSWANVVTTGWVAIIPPVDRAAAFRKRAEQWKARKKP